MTPDAAVEERTRLDLLAAATFPREWAKANSKPRNRSKARSNLRKRVVAHFRIIELRKSGASCGSCEHFAAYPHHPGRMICELGSDFQGYQIATADGICTSWCARKEKATT